MSEILDKKNWYADKNEIARLRVELNRLRGEEAGLQQKNAMLREIIRWIPVEERLPKLNGIYLTTHVWNIDHQRYYLTQTYSLSKGWEIEPSHWKEIEPPDAHP